MNKFFLAVFSMLCFGFCLQAQPYDAGQFQYQGQVLPYRFLKPEGLQGQKLPLVIFLHGAGERGADNQRQLTHGSELFSDSIEQYPALVIFPQCREDAFWPNGQIETNENGRVFHFEKDLLPNSPLHLVDLMIDSLIATGEIDERRIYVGGLSMGGMGTYNLVAGNPDLFAAAFAICGGGNAEAAVRYARNTPFWIFHGAKDDVVLIDYSIAMSEAISAAGGDPIFTIYPQANHNSWDSAFAETELLKWLFSHSQTRTKP